MSDNEGLAGLIGLGLIGIIIVALAAGFFIGYPEYKVWKMDKAGQAQLAEAEWTKRIAIEEAKADLESAKLEKEAMVIRAEGTSEANKIVSGSLDPLYIDYLVANRLVDSNTQVVYIPTEGSLPIIEAGRNIQKPTETDVEA